MIPELVQETRAFVATTRHELSRKSLQDLVRGSAQALGLHDVLRGLLDILKTAFQWIAEGLRYLAERVVEIAGAVAVAELFAPLMGGLGEAMASLTVQLSELGAPLPSSGGALAALRSVELSVALGAAYVGQELPKPQELLALADEVGVGLVQALAPFDPSNPTDRRLAL